MFIGESLLAALAPGRPDHGHTSIHTSSFVIIWARARSAVAMLDKEWLLFFALFLGGLKNRTVSLSILSRGSRYCRIPDATRASRSIFYEMVGFSWQSLHRYPQLTLYWHFGFEAERHWRWRTLALCFSDAEVQFCLNQIFDCCVTHFCA